jgi:hypothetical protein
MSKYARDFRRLLQLSMASMSIASACVLAAKADAQQSSQQNSLGYADAVVLPKYYPGMGRVMVLGGIESTKPVISTPVSHTQILFPQQPSNPLASTQTTIKVPSQQPSAQSRAGENNFTIQATVSPDQPNQLKVVVVQQPSSAPAATVVTRPVTPPATAETPQPHVNPQLAAPLPATPPQPTQNPVDGDGPKVTVEPNQESQLRRSTDERAPRVAQLREVQPPRDPPQPRREEPGKEEPRREEPRRSIQGIPLDDASVESPSRNQPNRNANQVREVRGAPPRDEGNRREVRPDENRDNNRRPGPDGPKGQGPGNPGPRDQGPRDQGPRDQGPREQGPREQGPRDQGSRDQGLSNQVLRPWMRGGMDEGNFSAPGDGPGWPSRGGGGPGRSNGPSPVNGPGPDLESMDRIFNSPAVRQFLQLKEENMQLKAELKLKEREHEMKMEMTEMRLRMHMQEAEKRVDQANQQLSEMKERAADLQKKSEQRPLQGFNFGASKPIAQELAELKEKLDEATTKLGSEHPNVVQMRKRIAEGRERLEKSKREAFDVGNDLRDAARAEEDVKKEQQQSLEALERLTQERSRVVGELHSQIAYLKQKLEAVVEEKSNTEKAIIEVKRNAEKQIANVKESAAEAIKKAEAAAQKAEMNKAEGKKAEAVEKEAKKEKAAKSKKEKDDGEDDAQEDENKGNDE